MSDTISIGAILVIVMMLGYMCIGTFIEKNQISFGHEAAYTILIGKFSL